jgi:exonuclease I
MEIAILVIISITLFIYTLWPSFKVAEPLIVELDVRQRRRKLLGQEKRNNLKAIKDIDFELATGKISEDDHEELKTLYSLKAAEAIEAEKQLEDESNDA